MNSMGVLNGPWLEVMTLPATSNCRLYALESQWPYMYVYMQHIVFVLTLSRFDGS